MVDPVEVILEGHLNNLRTLLANPVVVLILIILIGAIIGWLYEKQTHSPHGYITSALVGVAGSYTGYHLAALIAVPNYVAIFRLIAAAIGAIVVLWAWRTFHLRRKRR
jgi:uncharacterized membrane protein YeaQ/YmgE (transglycosylase-associated protein family)